jgi:hypothetical protein
MWKDHKEGLRVARWILIEVSQVISRKKGRKLKEYLKEQENNWTLKAIFLLQGKLQQPYDALSQP